MHTSPKKHSNKPLYGIAIAFMTPIILAHMLFHSGYGSNHHNNRGTLLSPPIQINSNTQDYWQIASLITPSKNEDKFTALTKRWQALGKDKKRVHLTVIQIDQKKTSFDENWEALSVNPKIIHKLKQSKSKLNKQCSLFIVTPKNDAILCYDQKNSPRDLDLDLRKLLKLSPI